MRKPSTPLRKLLAPLAAAVAIGATPLSLEAGGKGDAPGQAKGSAQSKLYIVQLREEPVVAYDGDIARFKATAPKKGQKIDPNSQAVIEYAAFLDNRHATVLNRVGGGRKVYDYHYTFNGFAAEVTAEQADQLRKLPGVVSVVKDEARALDTTSTPAFLGLTGPGGFYDTTGATGEGVIIGIVDGGIWPESLSFSDRTGVNGNASKDGKLSYQQIPGWHGKCVPGEGWNASNCNQKLIGAQWFNAGWGGDAGIDAQLPHEFNSARDFGGHGSHTASTAGGNANTPTDGLAAVFGSVSGIAPRARIAAYKVCWQTPAGGSCFSSDSMAAIDQAVADGVDVINFSISGTATNFLDPVEVAFLFAARAGVFVSASAGNAGPNVSTVAHPSPWISTVAAGTHNRNGEGSTTLGNSATYAGASFANATGPAPLIDSIAAGLPGAPAAAVALCFAAADNGGVPVLDPALVAGKIVVCDRGTNARVNKSLAVAQAGGVGMILANTSANSLNADFHFVPSVHVSHLDRAAIKAYAATADATASISQASVVFSSPAPFTASFSSRGPSLATGGDILKPDIIAPGQDILAAVAPPGNFGRNFDIYSGTSMSSPHIAGMGALFKDLYPGWSPMAIKSALMTTAGDVLDGGNTIPAVIFRQGAGHVRPNAAVNPGLVYNSNFNDWLAFLCGTTTGVAPATCSLLTSLGYSTDPSDMNTASIAIGNLAGVQTVTRKVTNVGGSAATYTPSYTGLVGFNVAFDPASLSLNAGQTKSYSVTFTRTSAALNAYTGGQVTLSDGSHNVRIPVVVQPVALSAPASVSGTGGDINYGIVFGYDGAFGAAARGMVPAAVTPGVVADDPTNSTCSLASPNAQLIPVNVPAGTTHARFSLFDADVAAGSDIDMCVFNGATLVGTSGSGTSAETVDLRNPAAATYTVVVQGWGVVGSSPFSLHTWLIDGNPAGNMSVSAPAAATTGATGTVTLSFSGLAAATKYMGTVAYSGVAGLPNPTIVRVDTP